MDTRERPLTTSLCREQDSIKTQLQNAQADGEVEANLALQHRLQRTLALVTEENQLQENALYEKSSTARAAELEMDRLQLEIKHSTHYIKVRTHKPSLAILFVLSPPPPIRLSACQQRHSYRPSPLAAARDN